MEDKANQALEQLLDRAISGVDQAVEFSQAQIPDVVEQLLMWHATESAIFMVLGLLLVIVPPIASGLIYRKLNKQGIVDDEEEHLAYFGASFMIWLLPLIGGLFMIFGNLDWLQILIAPKLYLLEYAADLVK